MRDGRGEKQRLKKIETTKKVRDFLEKNPTAIKKDVCEAIGISRVTLRVHLTILGVD